MLDGEDNETDDTMLQALQKRGGQLKALERHCAAALLNALNSDTSLIGDYFLSADDVKMACMEAFIGGTTIVDLEELNVNELKDLLDENNNLGCFENAHGEPNVCREGFVLEEEVCVCPDGFEDIEGVCEEIQGD